jgi:hypothetical protein
MRPEPIHLEISDQTFIAAGPAAVAELIQSPERWPQWWPDLRLDLSRGRGLKGCQWVLTGNIGGTAEIYLEPWQDGTIVHLFLRLELPGGVSRRRGSGPERARRSRTLRWKRTINRLKDELEGERRPGTAAATPGSAGSRCGEGSSSTRLDLTTFG